MPRVTAVVPNWNGRHLLDMVIGSLDRQTVRAERVVVVDDGSTDGSAEHLRAAWPDVEIVALERNVGFAAAANRGIERAVGDFVALINTDVELDARWLENMAAALGERADCGSVACKLVDWRRRDVLDGAGDTLRWSGVADRRGHGRRDDGRYDRPGPVFSACAAAALYRREALDDVGGFDERYFAYQEDVDWGFRAQLRGWRCEYVPTAVAFHMGSATTAESAYFHTLMLRNGVWTMLKNAPGGALARYGPLIVANQLVGLRASRRRGLARAHVAAWPQAAAGLPYVLRERRRIQAGRRVNRRYLETLIPSR